MTEAIRDIYKKKENEFLKKLISVENKTRLISYSRVLLAIAICVFFYYSLTYNSDFFYIVFFLILIFIFFVSIHTRLFYRRELLRNSVLINQREIAYLQNDYSSFHSGNEFINHSHPFSFDLDLFGEGSLFQSISRTVTLSGRGMLAQSLTQRISREEILARQQSIKELKGKLDFRQYFQATGLLLHELPGDREKFKNWLGEDLYFFNNKTISYLILILPVTTIISIITSIVISEFHISLLICIGLNWIVYGLNAKKINRIHSGVSKKKILLQNYSNLFKIVEDEKFDSPKLIFLKSKIENASLQFKKLANYVGWLDQRLNVFVSPIVNSIFLYDLQFCFLIEKWRDRNDKQMLLWMDSLGDIDVLNSLGNFHYNNPDFCFPEISDAQNLMICAMGVGHPLIKSSKRIPNDFKIGGDNQIAIVTGANMAGKSTFLRVIGINLVLAYTGAPVCASAFKTGILNLVSSMRITDSLKDDVSYFYAELKRLKTIRQIVEGGEPTLILLDEMLRGTNSKDKQQGSKAFVENLLPFNCLAIVATHDLMLGELESEYPGKIKNFSFESVLDSNELTFDYKIKDGIAKNTNASFLMKKLGII